MAAPRHTGMIRGKSSPSKGIAHIKDPVVRAQVAHKIKTGAIRRSKAEAVRLNSWNALHNTHCQVCESEMRPEIEADILAWGRAIDVAERYDLPIGEIVRHCRVTGVYTKRRSNHAAILQGVIERGMEQLDNDPTQKIPANAIISAADSLIRMSGGFRDNLNVTSEEEAMQRWKDAPIEEIMKNRQQFIRDQAGIGSKK